MIIPAEQYHFEGKNQIQILNNNELYVHVEPNTHRIIDTEYPLQTAVISNKHGFFVVENLYINDYTRNDISGNMLFSTNYGECFDIRI